jgi:GntR family transcriptional regulator
MNTRPTHRLLLPPISSAAPGTLYQQVVDGLKREIAEGRIPPGSALPSFRALAEDLLVSIITVKRAYEELEHEGIIYRRQGVGTFVSEDGATRMREAKRVRAEELLREAVKEALDAGMTEDEIGEIVPGIVHELAAGEGIAR